MARQFQDFTLYQGNTFDAEWLIDNEDGTPKDMSPASDIFFVASKHRDSAVIFTRSKDAGHIVLFDADGTKDGIRVTIAEANTSSLLGRYAYELYSKDTSTDYTTLATGTMTVLDSLRV